MVFQLCWVLSVWIKATQSSWKRETHQKNINFSNSFNISVTCFQNMSTVVQTEPLASSEPQVLDITEVKGWQLFAFRVDLPSCLQVSLLLSITLRACPQTQRCVNFPNELTKRTPEWFFHYIALIFCPCFFDNLTMLLHVEVLYRYTQLKKGKKKNIYLGCWHI